MTIKSDVKTAAALLDQFYEKRRLLILSAPNISDSDYQLQNIMVQVRELKLPVTLNQHSIDSLTTLMHVCVHQKADCGLDLRHVTVMELLGSPPRETGRIKESQLNTEVIEEFR